MVYNIIDYDLVDYQPLCISLHKIKYPLILFKLKHNNFWLKTCKYISYVNEEA